MSRSATLQTPGRGSTEACTSSTTTSTSTSFSQWSAATSSLPPTVVQEGVTHFFTNVGEVRTLYNSLFQLKAEKSLITFGRFVTNTTLGIGGLFDPATSFGLQQQKEDFGQTLGYWGVGEGYYLVLPFFGPSTTRDVWGLPVDNFLLDPVTYVDPVSLRYSIRGTDVVDKRANLLRIEKAFEETQIDPYSFQRQTYLQRRRELTYDGNPPRPKLEFEEPEAEAPPAQ